MANCQLRAYYQWIQGTSMASPHAVGVAGVDPREAWAGTARVASLPSYADKGRGPSFIALEGDAEFNGYYGHGIVDAHAAVH